MVTASGAILVVEDDGAVGTVLVRLLEQSGFSAKLVSSADEALRTLQESTFDVVLSDVRMQGMDGLELLKEIGRRIPNLPVVLLTAHGSVPLAVEAMKAGAIDFMLKPFDKDELLFVVRKALAHSDRVSTETPQISLDGAEIVGSSPAMNQVLSTIRKVASGTATVLIRGETGTGKELVARALHESGTRRPHPFVRVHCAALPDALLESELFGYEKGAFTGAVARKPGRVELAHRGTLFLDEIGDITPQIQVKLLRVLQEREFERVGGTQTIKVDVRFVAATHRNLEAMVAKGEFREDLFYRLNVVPVTVPPLRERADDIERLALHFARVLGAANGKPKLVCERAALDSLRAYLWPGNVRQLQNLIERLIILSDSNEIREVDVARELGSNTPSSSEETSLSSLDGHRQEAEKEAVVNALARAGNNRTLAARLLKVSRRTLYNKLEEYGLS